MVLNHEVAVLTLIGYAASNFKVKSRIIVIEPSDYYASYDSIATSMSDVARNIKAVTSYGERQGLQVFWRGQAHHEWGLLSSLVRGLSASGPVDDKTLNLVEASLLREATLWIKEISEKTYSHPLAKLAYLQHHGIPTRLLDFTSCPWTALFFAAESFDAVDGRMFAILVEADSVLATTPRDRPWSSYKTKEVKVYDAVKAGVSFPRLESQRGVLVLGRMPSTTPYRKAYDRFLGKERSMLAEEVRRILSIPIKIGPFQPTNMEAPLSSKAKPPLAITFRIHVDKESIRRDLSGLGSGKKISPKHLKLAHHHIYPDVGGMVQHSRTLNGLRKGLLIL